MNVTETHNTVETAAPRWYRFQFFGKGSDYFAIVITNFILSVFTLGLYYPWARVNTLKFLYEHTELDGSRFSFTGTGKELFVGFLKLYALLVGFYIAIVICAIQQETALFQLLLLLFYVGLLALIPFAIHAALKYRTAKTTWRNIRMGYRGDRSELIAICVKGMLLTIITLGIYSPWFTIQLRRYLISNIRFGDVRFSYLGDGGDYFVLLLKGYFLTVITLGLYLPWFAKERINYLIQQTDLHLDDATSSGRSAIKGLDYLILTVTNLFLILFTFGIGTPWAIMRSYTFIINNIAFAGDVNLDQATQTEGNYSDAAGEDALDMLDVGII
ncbi:MAG: DUF898 family protein [Bacteroidetes bacterium]|nr:MAG: DUF898 family protein [Bacteroidota bacterium]TAF93619.1 MAG: DUF898 family protein [Bacteroidota bacterium]